MKGGKSFHVKKKITFVWEKKFSHAIFMEWNVNMRINDDDTSAYREVEKQGRRFIEAIQ